jgi:drug/metabolite transporter (DMT)-like permease
VSGLGYGIGTAFLVDVTDDAGVWPVASQRGMAFITIILWAMLRKRPLLPPMRFAPQSTAAGLFGGLSTALLLAGFTFNAAATSVTASLFPATSVAAGRLFFGDAVNRAQVIGLVIVIIGTITIVIA